MPINVASVLYFGQPIAVACDSRCGKAWGEHRPRVQLSADPDDYEMLADDELGDAPANPGTYEGGEGKPSTAAEFPTKWCVRQCERCAHAEIGKPTVLPDLTSRIRNITGK